MKTFLGIFFLFLVLLIFTGITSCTVSKDTASNYQEPEIKTQGYEKLAKEKFGKNYKTEFNSNKSYVLCIKKENPAADNSYGSFQYFVYELKNEKIVYQESISNGSIEWINDHQFKVSIIPGIVHGDEKKENRNFGYVYDLNLKRKISNSKKENLLDQ